LIESFFSTDSELTEQFNELAIALAEQSGEDKLDSEDFRLLGDSVGETIGFG
tara:strand:+ start:630 stop:785 length:156 start_codon:yes stop_codon:yes gene_type:complete